MSGAPPSLTPRIIARAGSGADERTDIAVEGSVTQTFGVFTAKACLARAVTKLENFIADAVWG